MINDIHTVVFWGAGATASLGMVTTAQQNGIFLALSKKQPGDSYEKCLEEYKENVFGERFEDVCDLLTLLDDDPDSEIEHDALGYRMSGFSDRQKDIVNRHAEDLGNEDRKRFNRVIMMRLRYDWAAVMRILRLQKYNTKKKTDDEGNEIPSDTFTLTLYNLIDANISAGTGIHVFDNEGSELSNFLDVVRLKSAKSALVMFVNLMFASAWAKNIKEDGKLVPYMRFGGFIAQIRAEEARDTMREGNVAHLFRTSFVSMNFDPMLWWILKNADVDYNDNPFYIGYDRMPLYLGEDVDQVDAVRDFKTASRNNQGRRVLFNDVLSEQVARFVNQHGENSRERCNVRYQTVKIFFPHGSPNIKICPCCGKTTLYQGNELAIDSASLFPPFFFKRLTWACEAADALPGTSEEYSESRKWGDGELDYIQCRHCGRAIRMCDTEMVMQSGLKSPPSYLLQRISHNVDNAVMRANHIVLMGYSLPPDDGAWVAELQARTTRDDGGEVFCSVMGYDPTAGFHWMYKGELEGIVKCQKSKGDENHYSAVENAWKVFGKDRVRACMIGVPGIFESKETVREILYPDFDEWREKVGS